MTTSRLGPLLADPEELVGARCELCGASVGDGHPHVVDVQVRALLCACRACALLFTNDRVTQQRYRRVPYRHEAAIDVRILEADWQRFHIPVDLAFFFHDSAHGRTVGFYPGPHGATEAVLSLRDWRDLVERNPSLADLAPDVEALLVRRRGARCDCFRVPVDRCYELIARMRGLWCGLDGGEAAWDEIDAFFAELGDRDSDFVLDLVDGGTSMPASFDLYACGGGWEDMT